MYDRHVRTPIHLTGDPDADAESWGKRLAGPAVDAAPAAKALAGLGTMRSLEVLLEGTSLPDGMSRGIAATAVGSHPLASAARERLEELLRDPSEYVASAARGALELVVPAAYVVVVRSHQGPERATGQRHP